MNKQINTEEIPKRKSLAQKRYQKRVGDYTGYVLVSKEQDKGA